MKNRFKLMSLLLALGMAVSFSSCSEDDDNNGDDNNNDTGNVIVTENITENTTWTSDKVYQLGGRIVVEAGATLTIEPGTIIKGEAGTGVNATALLIAKDAKIMAEGTADAPIIFTSVADEITPEQVASGDFKSPNLDPTANGYWGGLLVLGNAPISVAEGNSAQIEGIPSTDTNGRYGGDDPDDNSGVLKYISIRHGGSNIGEGNEINGLTLGGVGSGTVIENVEVVANQDDAIEWFGGTVNVTNAVVWNAGDDGLDADQGWNGTCENFVIVSPDDHLFELDGIEGNTEDPSEIQRFGSYTFRNGYVIANTDDATSSDLINLDPETSVHFENIFFTEIAEGQQITLKDEATLPDGFLDGVSTTFTDVVLNVTDVEPFIDGTASGISAGTAPADASAIDITVFNWTWADQAGAIVAW
ncbi:hypothetical protein [Anaerophaga thermohalophila]|uniref:hypothetical protein n=1 Tax=Anaerophaga thermohalophila TaxID=177400 RepID=UPI0003047FC7|nr:hypothetical protein [Anaerophaga thermohalophila]